LQEVSFAYLRYTFCSSSSSYDLPDDLFDKEKGDVKPTKPVKAKKKVAGVKRGIVETDVSLGNRQLRVSILVIKTALEHQRYCAGQETGDERDRESDDDVDAEADHDRDSCMKHSRWDECCSP
jgi:hypothetical protein